MSEYQTRQELESNLVAKAWQDEAFKQQLMSDPKSVIAEAGISLREDIKVEVIEETDRTFYIVIPQAPSQVDELSEAELQSVAGGGLSDWVSHGQQIYDAGKQAYQAYSYFK